MQAGGRRAIEKDGGGSGRLEAPDGAGQAGRRAAPVMQVNQSMQPPHLQARHKPHKCKNTAEVALSRPFYATGDARESGDTSEAVTAFEAAAARLEAPTVAHETGWPDRQGRLSLTE